MIYTELHDILIYLSNLLYIFFNKKNIFAKYTESFARLHIKFYKNTCSDKKFTRLVIKVIYCNSDKNSHFMANKVNKIN